MNARIIKNKRRPWEAPTLRPVQLTGLNKFGKRTHHSHDDQECIEGRSIDALLEEFGSPLFVTSEQRLRSNQQSLMQAFASRYPQRLRSTWEEVFPKSSRVWERVKVNRFRSWN